MEIFIVQALLILFYCSIIILSLWLGWRRGRAKSRHGNQSAALGEVVLDALFSSLGAAIGIGAAAGLVSVGANIIYDMPLERAFWMPLIAFILVFAVFFPGFIISFRTRKTEA